MGWGGGTEGEGKGGQMGGGGGEWGTKILPTALVHNYQCIIIIIIIDCFYIALFSALEQTHCARM